MIMWTNIDKHRNFKVIPVSMHGGDIEYHLEDAYDPYFE